MHHAPPRGCISKRFLEPGVPSVISHVLDLTLDRFEFGPDFLAVAVPRPQVIIGRGAAVVDSPGGSSSSVPTGALTSTCQNLFRLLRLVRELMDLRENLWR